MDGSASPGAHSPASMRSRRLASTRRDGGRRSRGGTWPYFAPDASERITAYLTAAKLSYRDLLSEIADLRKDETRGQVDPRAGARERIALMSQRLAEVSRLREVYE